MLAQVIDVKTRAVVGVINGFDGPSGMVLHGRYGYVNNPGASDVWNPTTRTNDPRPNAVGSGSGHTVTVVDLRTRQITGRSTIWPAAGAITATVGGITREFSNPNDFQVLYATPGTVSGGLYNVAGHGVSTNSRT